MLEQISDDSQRDIFQCEPKVEGGVQRCRCADKQWTLPASQSHDFPQGLKQKLQIIDAVHYHSRCVCECVCVQITLYCAKTSRWFIYGPLQ